MKLTETTPLFALSRSRTYEVVVHGIAAFHGGKGEFEHPADDMVIVSRSLLKPWQFMYTEVGDEQPFWSVGLASHNGEAKHLAALHAIIAEANINTEHLMCPEAYPMGDEDAWTLKLAGNSPGKLYHPCSGKHLSLLAACKKHGFPERNYTELSHPLHGRLDEKVRALTGTPNEWFVDSCGVPTMATSLLGHMQMWERLCLDRSDRAMLVKKLWTENPVLVGGANRLDSSLIQWGKGRILAKEGADGLLAVFARSEDGEPVQGTFIKLASGYNSKHLGLALWGILSDHEAELNPIFKSLYSHLDQVRHEWLPEDQVLIPNPT